MLVHGEVERPGVGPQTSPPAIALPGFVSDAPGLRYGTELPKLVAGTGVVGARVPDATDRSAWGVRADHDDVLVYQRDRIVRHHHVDLARLPETRCRCAGLRVDGNQTAPRGEDDTRWRSVVTGPIGDPAPRRRACLHQMPPELGTGRRVERYDAVHARQIHDVVDDDGRYL